VDTNSISSDKIDPKLEDKLKRKTMKVSIAEGSFGVFSSVLVDNYMVPFSLSINSTPFQVGMFTSLGNLISPLGQIVGSRKTEIKSRKSILLTGILGQASIWPLFLIIAILYQFNIFQSFLPFFPKLQSLLFLDCSRSDTTY